MEQVLWSLSKTNEDGANPLAKEQLYFGWSNFLNQRANLNKMEQVLWSLSKTNEDRALFYMAWVPLTMKK